MKSVGRLAFKLWLCAAFAQGLVFLAFFNNLAAARTAAIEQQLRTIVARVVGPASARAALGLPVEYQTDLQPLLDQMAQVTKGRADLFIVNPERLIAFASEKSMIGSRIPPQWAKPGGLKEDVWHFSTSREVGVGASISSPVYSDAGSVIVRSATGDVAVDVVSALRTPVVTGLGFLVLVGALVTFGTALASRSLSARFAMIGDAYRASSAVVRAGKVPEDGPATPCLFAVRGIMSAFAATEADAIQADHVAPNAYEKAAPAKSGPVG